MNVCENVKNCYQSLRISYESYEYVVTIFLNSSEPLTNPFRMLQIHTNAVANIANAFKRLMNKTITLRVLANIVLSAVIRWHP